MRSGKAFFWSLKSGDLLPEWRLYHSNTLSGALWAGVCWVHLWVIFLCELSSIGQVCVRVFGAMVVPYGGSISSVTKL